jgi:hypothetical protein
MVCVSEVDFWGAVIVRYHPAQLDGMESRFVFERASPYH